MRSLSKVKSILAGVLLVVPLAFAHYYIARPVTNPVSVVGTATLGTATTNTQWFCVNAAGSVSGGPWTTQALAEVPCGTAVAADGVTRYLEERVTTSRPTTQTTSTRRVELVGGTSLRVSDTHAGIITQSGPRLYVSTGGGGGGGDIYPAATHYADDTASGSGDGSSGNPWTITQAFANAQAGNVVLFRAGTYTGTSPNDPTFSDNFSCVWTPTNVGTSVNPIVFMAENAGSSNPSLYSKLEHTAASDDVGAALLCDRDYVQFIGFYINGADALLIADSGHVILQNQGSVVRDFYVDGHMHSTFTTPQDNASFVRIEGAQDCHVRGSYVTGHGNGQSHHNGSAVITYDAVDCRVYNNTIVDSDGGIYFKGAATFQTGNWAYRNLIINSNTIGIEFGVNQSGNRGKAYQNVIIGANLGIDYGRTSAVDVDIVNNTIYGSASDALSLRNTSGLVLRNNILASNVRAAIWNRSGSAITAFDTNYNLFNGNGDAVGAGDYSVTYDLVADYFAAVQPGDENNSINAAPTFTSVVGNDLSLQAGSQGEDDALDYLNIQGLGTGATINIGAYIGNATYDTIGSSL